MKYKYFFLFIVILLISEFFIIMQNLEQKKELQGFQKMKPILESTQSELSLLNEERDFLGKDLFNKFDKKPNNTAIVLWFSHEDCGYCIDNAVENLNKIAKETDAYVAGVIAVGNKFGGLEAVKEMYNIQFEFFDKKDFALNEDIYKIKETPLIVLGDISSNKIIAASFIKPDRKTEQVFLPVAKRFLNGEN